MAPLKLSSIISCSSEDRTACSTNLLQADSFKKWSTEKPGLLKATVLLQLPGPHLITGLDIGNNGSAFVEVLVGNSGSEDYENLIITSGFMSPAESRSQTNRYKMRLFSKADLCKATLDKKWDRLKVICTQPYNKQVTYGLSVFTVQSVGQAALKVEPPVKALTPSKPVQREEPASSRSTVKQEETKSETTESRAAAELFSKLQNSTSSKEALERLKATGHKKTTPPIMSRYLHSSVIDIRDEDDKDQAPTSSNPRTTPFSELLEGVVFVLSGFQNPLRADIREIGLSMGASYRPDWCRDATHLICAVPNTPKYNQVKGKGIIVGKDWFFDCKRLKRREPEAMFRLHKPAPQPTTVESSSDEEDEEDEEEEEEVSRPVTKRKQPKKIVYCEEDSDDEVENVSRKRRKEDEDEFVPSLAISSDDEKDIHEATSGVEEVNVPSPPAKNRPLPDISDSDEDMLLPGDPFETETDDETQDDVIIRLNLPSLPNFFAGHSFYLHSDALSMEQSRQLTRYLVGYGGKVREHMARDVKFIVTGRDAWQADFQQALTVNPAVRFLKRAWVVDSSNELKALDKRKYYINQ